MAMFTMMVSEINAVVWGVPMLVLILGVGLFLMLGSRLFPLKHIGNGFLLLWRGRHPDHDARRDGEINPFNALMTSLSATIGTGNIAGVATAIFMGGPGALFWMWVTALVGMATKFAEAFLAVTFREVDARGNHVGGPMYYIKNGMGKRWAWLGSLFAFFAAIAGFGIGNTVQANSVADALHKSFHWPEWVTGLVLMFLVGLVLLGGVKRIAHVAGRLVPLMALLYVGTCVIVLLINVSMIPAAIILIVKSAFTPVAAKGGFAGSVVWLALRYGVARGVFSNEAGLGSAPIAHACAQTRDPVAQGMIAMLGTFIDTLIICTMTGLALVVTQAWTSGSDGALMTSVAFSHALGAAGGYIVGIALSVFAFTTMVGWSLYGEKSVQYLFGLKAVPVFRVLWVLVIPLGATLSLHAIWLVADTLNALMAIPNLIALLVLSPLIFKAVKNR